MRNFETHHVTIDLKEIDPQSTAQSSESKPSVKKTKKTVAQKILQSSTKPKNKVQKTLVLTSRSKISPRKFIKGQNRPKGGSKLKLETSGTKCLSESPVKEYIHNSLRNHNKINPSHPKPIVKPISKLEKSAPRPSLMTQRTPIHPIIETRKSSKESSMCNPVSCNSSRSEMKPEDIQANIDAYDNRLNRCLDLAKSEENFDIRQQLFKAFGYDEQEEQFYMGKRRGGLENQSLELASPTSGRVLHIRKNWDPLNKITPTSSIQTSELSKFVKTEGVG